MKLVQSEKEFKDTLKEAKEAEKLVVVDFYAEWCGPCKVLAPLLEKMSGQHPQVVFLKVDVDKLEDLAAEYGITAMPTIIFLKDGQKVATVVGANVSLIEAHIDEHSKTKQAAFA